MCNPYGFGYIEAVEVGWLAEQWAAVGCEGEYAVEAVRDFCVLKGGEELLGVFPSWIKVFGCEFQARGHVLLINIFGGEAQ